jgi:NADPH:quinone reductase-like Zn-dependent oxidoreductase
MGLTGNQSGMSVVDRSPADVVRHDHVIRLTQYRYRKGGPSQAEIEEFVAAWKEANAASAVLGVVYRELCRQVPQWSAMAAEEIDYPIDAVFLEYAITEPTVDSDALDTVPAALTDRYTAVTDLHTVAFRFVKASADTPSGAVMFNLFEIDGPAAMEQGFLMGWPPRGEFKIREQAIRSTILHQRMLAQATIKAFNRAEISSAAAYAEGVARFEAAFPRSVRTASGGAPGSGAKPPIRSHLGLFEIVAVSPAGAPVVNPDMAAVVFEEYGGPQVLQLQRVRRPDPGPGQIRVKVRASALNPLDERMRSGEVRHVYPPWFPDVLGLSIAGVVDAVGRGVSTPAVGDQVYGVSHPIRRHGYAEYVVAPAKDFYRKPSSMDFPAAATAPSVIATAYGALFLRTGLRAGQTVLIHGGSGGVGSYAVQLAKLAGARVIATASGSNLDRVRGLGADVAVDYRTQRFEDFARDVDVVLDTVGGETRNRSWPLIRRGGVLATLQPPPPDQTVADRYGVQAFMVHGHPDISEILPEMTRLLESGELAFPEIATTFPLEQAAQAHAAVESGARGRIALVVA